MSKTILLFAPVFIAACSTKPPVSNPCPSDTVIVEVPVVDSTSLDSMVNLLAAQSRKYDSLVILYDSVIVTTDTLATRLLRAQLKLNNVKYYLNITLRNPSQDKFLKGWVRRALQE